jgi:ER membrane protein complex subunit 1
MYFSPSIIYSRLACTHDTVYAIGLVKSIASYSLYISAISAADGIEKASAHIPSAIYNGLTDFLVLSDITSGDPLIVWLEFSASAPKQSQIRFANLNPEMRGQPKALKGATFKKILNIGLNEFGYFVALREDGSAMALKMDRDSRGVSLIWEFEESVHIKLSESEFKYLTYFDGQAHSEKHSESSYAGGLDKDGNPYIGRVFWSNVLQVVPYPSNTVRLTDR